MVLIIIVLTINTSPNSDAIPYCSHIITCSFTVNVGIRTILDLYQNNMVCGKLDGLHTVSYLATTPEYISSFYLFVSSFTPALHKQRASWCVETNTSSHTFCTSIHHPSSTFFSLHHNTRHTAISTPIQILSHASSYIPSLKGAFPHGVAFFPTLKRLPTQHSRNIDSKRMS